MARRPGGDLARRDAGRISVVCRADVPDGPILGRNASNVLVALRQPAHGQIYQFHLERLAWVDELVARHGVRRAFVAADVKAAHAAGEPAIILDIEGLASSRRSSSASPFSSVRDHETAMAAPLTCPPAGRARRYDADDPGYGGRTARS